METNISSLFSEAVVALFRANGKLLEWGDAFAAPFSLTSARWQILGAIARAGDRQTAPQVADLMGVSRQGAQKQLNLLVEDGLVEKLSNPSHLRSPHYRLTKNGKDLYQQISTAWDTHATAAGALFSEKDLEITLRTLNQLTIAHLSCQQGEANEK